MVRYALDTDVLSHLKVAREEVIALGGLPVLVTDVVWSEFTDSRGRQEDLKLDEKMLQTMARAPRVIAPQTPEAAAFTRLLNSKPQIGDGEISIISIAIHEADVVPVLIDQRALFRAVEELRGRVLAFHGFLDVLRRQHNLSAQVANKLSVGFLKRRNLSHPPLWW